MSDRLKQFLVDLASSPERMARYLADPRAELNGTFLSTDEKAMLLARDFVGLRRALGPSLESTAVAVFVLVAIVILGAHIAQFGDYIADDAAITFAYAKNLLMGHGLVLNRGTDPVEGYSNFGWLLMVMPFCAHGANPTVPIKILSYAIGVVTLIIMGLTAQQLARQSVRKNHEWLCGAAAVGLAASTPYAFWVASGMENGLYCALFVIALLLYLRGSLVGCAVALVGLSLTRFEGIGVAAMFAIHRAGVLAFTRERPSRRDVIASVLFLSVYGTYAGWHWWRFRAFYPNSYLAKSILREDSFRSLSDVLARGSAYAEEQFIGPYHFRLVVPFVVVGLLGTKWRVMSLMLILSAGISALVLLTGGDFYPQFRLGTLILPLLFLLLIQGARIVVSWTSSRALALAALVPIVIVSQPSVEATRSVGKPISMNGLKAVMADRFTEIATGLKRRPITVMESDIGSVAYFTDFGVLDLGGLANLQVARYGFYPPFFLHQVFEESKPDIIHLRDNWARGANIPNLLILRDYQQIEGSPKGGYAEGWFVRRDVDPGFILPAPNELGPDHPFGGLRPSGQDATGQQVYSDALNAPWWKVNGRWVRYRPANSPDNTNSSTSGVDPNEWWLLALWGTPAAPETADFAAELGRQCRIRPDDCHALPALAAQAQRRAEGYRKSFRYAEAFEWYVEAYDADRRNLAALRAREDMRLAATAPSAFVDLRGFNTLRAHYVSMFDAGWIPDTLTDIGGVADAVTLAHFTVPDRVLGQLETSAKSSNVARGHAIVYLRAQVARERQELSAAMEIERRIVEDAPRAVALQVGSVYTIARTDVARADGARAPRGALLVTLYVKLVASRVDFKPFIRIRQPHGPDIDVTPIVWTADATEHDPNRLHEMRFIVPYIPGSTYSAAGAMLKGLPGTGVTALSGEAFQDFR
jgi:hypothetical protein